MTVKLLALLLIALLVGLSMGSASQSAGAPEIMVGDADMPRHNPTVRRKNMMATDAGFAGAAEGAPAAAAPHMNMMGMMKASAADLPADVTRTRVIETANGYIQVAHLREALEKAQAMVREAGGTVASQNERDLSDNGLYGTADVTFKVPVERFRATWKSLLQLASV